jgi:hypothetical protein
MVNGSAANEFSVGAEQGYAVMATMKRVIEPEIEVNSSFSERIKIVGIRCFHRTRQLPFQESGFRSTFSSFLSLADVPARHRAFV